MGEASTKLVEQLYGFDWIGLVSREQGVELLEGLMDSDFSARVSPEVGDRELRGVDGLINFIDALERDFEEFRYVADEIADAPGGRVVVRGDRRPWSREQDAVDQRFGHVWSVHEDRVLRVEAFLDRAAAESAAGM